MYILPFEAKIKYTTRTIERNHAIKAEVTFCVRGVLSPLLSKRVLRAILKATDLCAADPAQVAQQLADRGFTDRYDYALQGLSELPYDKWRDYDAEDTIRFYALRMHEAGFIRSTPQKIIA